MQQAAFSSTSYVDFSRGDGAGLRLPRVAPCVPAGARMSAAPAVLQQYAPEGACFLAAQAGQGEQGSPRLPR